MALKKYWCKLKTECLWMSIISVVHDPLRRNNTQINNKQPVTNKKYKNSVDMYEISFTFTWIYNIFLEVINHHYYFYFLLHIYNK